MYHGLIIIVWFCWCVCFNGSARVAKVGPPLKRLQHIRGEFVIMTHLMHWTHDAINKRSSLPSGKVGLFNAIPCQYYECTYDLDLFCSLGKLIYFKWQYEGFWLNWWFIDIISKQFVMHMFSWQRYSLYYNYVTFVVIFFII